MFGITYENDFKEPRRKAKKIIDEHLVGRGEFTFSYVAQTLSATVVCTLGLILNSTAVIIGGMIIAPLMWPILKIAYGLAIKRNKISYKPFVILLISVLTIFLGAAAVAFISPYKQLTSEIVLRTAPTTLEIFIALAAAVIAALAVTHPRINDAVAGVAVATSLVPPLCVSGIGLAYLDTSVMYGGFLLFLTNAVTIMLVATVIFTVFIFGKDLRSLRNRHIVLIVLILLVISLPLSTQLRTSIASASASREAQNVIEEQLDVIAPNSTIEEYQAVLTQNDTKVVIRAIVLLPPSRSITYEQEQEIREELASRLGKQVDLQLVLQNTLQPITQEEIAESSTRLGLEQRLDSEIEAINASLELNTVSIQLTEEGVWDIAASIRTSNKLLIGLEDKQRIEQLLNEEFGVPVTVSFEIIESRIISADQTQREEDIKNVSDLIERRLRSSRVLDLTIDSTEESDDFKVTADVLVPVGFEYDDDVHDGLEKYIASRTGKKVDLSISIIEYSTW